MNAVILILAGIGVLAGIGIGIFTVLVVSIHRAGPARLPESADKPAGAIARRVLIGIRDSGTEDSE